MAIYKIISLFVFFCLISCNSGEVTIRDLDWLQGTWQIEGKPVFEEWSKINPHLYRGKGYTIRKNDTLITETIEIAQTGSEIFYIPQVPDKNDGKAVMFKLISDDPEYLVFENKTHDFPQRIIYDKNGKDRIDASIEGEGENGYSKVKFPYVKAAHGER